MDRFDPAGGEGRPRGPLHFDVFLSHAAADAQRADAVRLELMSAGHSVYCDRFDDPSLDRTRVTAETASRLRDRMMRCNVLVYVVSETAHESKWMPWELGYFDGFRGKVFVYATSQEALVSAREQEYLSLFPTIEPGSLLHALRPAVEEGRVLRDMLNRREMIGKPGLAATDIYREDIQDAYRFPLDGERIASLNLEIWNSWLRLWGFGQR